MADVEELIDRYRREQQLYEQLATEAAHVLEVALRKSPVRVHNIEHRVKTVDSLAEKLRRPGKNYSDLVSIADLAGIRVVVYELPHLDVVVQLCAELFDVEEMPQDQPSQEQVNHFGYMSKHLIIKAGEVRAALVEWQPIGDRKAEIQIRTVLQHAWADVSHEYEYKQERDVPPELRRRLSRVSALLEVADSEFSAIASAHIARRQALQADSSIGGWDAGLDKDSIAAWMVKEEGRIRSITEIAQRAGFKFDSDEFAHPDEDERGGLNYVLSIAEHVGLRLVSDLDRVLDAEPQVLKAYFERLTKLSKNEWGATPAFIVALAVLLLHHRCVSPDDLIEDGWSPDLAERVTREAEAAMSD